ncbi:glycosyltransferase [Paenibacillus polymyxa]|uniref:glycosyltransferase n=1 Tax=Paenibacillus polymyxa TaxID=1406 RepID=UPI001BE8EC3A|nr:glycosyltransferase [Paenibacillus polymyxa]MBT2282936.1 glycosyltransferase [Paenibacillus polymyxa]
MKIWHLPIERIPTRYSYDWTEQFEMEFQNNQIDYQTIGDNLIRPVRIGSVLDVYETSKYKFKQLNEVIHLIETKSIKGGDIVLLADGWFPGLEALYYIRAITKVNFLIAAIWHAGSYDSHDFLNRFGMRDWALHQELAWFTGIDIIFVATEFHKQLLISNSGEFDIKKIFVTGLPFYSKSLSEKYTTNNTKENIIIFPHRLDSEKNPNKFDALAERFSQTHPDWKFVKTLEVTSSREAYFKLLEKSKFMISFAEQESFGYSTLEAMALGVRPIVPNKLSYPETVPEQYRYTDENEVDALIIKHMNEGMSPEFNLTKWEFSITNMIEIMKNKSNDYNCNNI